VRTLRDPMWHVALAEVDVAAMSLDQAQEDVA
jgi:hypothetical protein